MRSTFQVTDRNEKVLGSSGLIRINQSVVTGPDIANHDCGLGRTSGSVIDFAEGSRFFFILVVSQQKIVSLSII